MAFGKKTPAPNAPVPSPPPAPLTKGEKLRLRAAKLRNLPRLIEPMQRRAVDPVSETLMYVGSELLEALADALEEKS
jgi:hypothetical protein